MTEYIQSEDIVMRKIGDSYFLIDIHQNYSTDNMFLHINDIGGFIWEILGSAITVEGISEILLAKLSDRETCDRDEIIRDISSFIDLLTKSGYVRGISNG